MTTMGDALNVSHFVMSPTWLKQDYVHRHILDRMNAINDYFNIYIYIKQDHRPPLHLVTQSDSPPSVRPRRTQTLWVTTVSILIST